jgi:hypothetical protein
MEVPASAITVLLTWKRSSYSQPPQVVSLTETAASDQVKVYSGARMSYSTSSQ